MVWFLKSKNRQASPEKKIQTDTNGGSSDGALDGINNGFGNPNLNLFTSSIKLFSHHTDTSDGGYNRFGNPISNFFQFCIELLIRHSTTSDGVVVDGSYGFKSILNFIRHSIL
ncbi:hypothetical protein Hanom_Chr01g00077951 [Helianthus anomalus]